MRKTILLRGTAAAAIAAILSWAASIAGLGRLYYLSVLLPAAAFACLVVSWFLHLREDGFFKAPGRLRPRRAGTNGLVARNGEGEEPRDNPSDGKAEGRTAAKVLLVAAVELALLATALYVFAGIGASYFL
jgi:hypothetical protein